MKHYDHFTSFKGNKITRIESQFRLNSLKRVSHQRGTAQANFENKSMQFNKYLYPLLNSAKDCISTKSASTKLTINITYKHSIPLKLMSNRFMKSEKTTQLGNTNETNQQEKTTQLSSRNETTQLVSRNETTQLNRRKQLNSSVETKQLNSALPSTACNHLQPPSTAYNRLQPPTTACPAYNRLHRLQPPAPPTTACTAFTAESAFSTYSHDC
ncbi:hypothetical protein TNCV_3327961 [Trichonephila clavipes]|nr:hypothetical protein TNCV_3327961 [Trichonephila clavipes]